MIFTFNRRVDKSKILGTVMAMQPPLLQRLYPPLIQYCQMRWTLLCPPALRRQWSSSHNQVKQFSQYLLLPQHQLNLTTTSLQQKAQVLVQSLTPVHPLQHETLKMMRTLFVTILRIQSLSLLCLYHHLKGSYPELLKKHLLKYIPLHQESPQLCPMCFMWMLSQIISQQL